MGLEGSGRGRWCKITQRIANVGPKLIEIWEGLQGGAWACQGAVLPVKGE